jgi:polysaccharide pyruvyl transferase WcaK-like protein
MTRSVMTLSAQQSGVALISPCGFGNLGDAAIMSAAIAEIRARLPEAEIVAFTLNPPDTTERHGIPAYAIDASTLAGFGRPRASDRGLRWLTESVLQRANGVSSRVSVALRRVVNALTRPWREFRHWRLIRRVVGRCRYVVVCGGGQLDEFWGGPWGHPYAMFKFAYLSRRVGARFVILSSGSATLRSAIGRRLIGYALRAASYRSFREDFAVDLARGLGAPEPNSWCPDLAFSLSVPTIRPQRRPRRRIGVSPIAWCDPRSWPEQDSRRYESYLERLVEFLRQALAKDDEVVLFATAGADHRVIADLVERIGAEQTAALSERLHVSPARTVPDLLGELSGLDVVVASRLHGVLLSYAYRVPVAAVSYDPKVDFLVHRLRQEAASVPIADFESGQLLEIVDALYQDCESIAQHLDQEVSAWQTLLAEQYDAVFGEVPAPAGATAAQPTEAVML